MPKIYDNIEYKLTDGLNDAVDIAHRADFCVGYFNLRGWKEIAGNIDKFSGGQGHSCRVLVGMQRQPQYIIEKFYTKTENEYIDNQKALKLKKVLAQEFKDQLTLGYPTEADEKGLRKLSRQIKEQKVFVKLYLKTGLHAKLYLLFRDDKINPSIGYLGSSNLTLADLSRQGELNIDVLDQDAADKLAKWFEVRWNDRWCIDKKS